MASLIDTNILVYRYDGRFPEKQLIATQLLREGIANDTVRLAHQTLVEFVAAVSRGPDPILPLREARIEVEEMLLQFTVFYPNADLLRLASRASAMYEMAWFDAQMWAYAEFYGCGTLVSEDFQHERTYGTVRVENPFLA